MEMVQEFVRKIEYLEITQVIWIWKIVVESLFSIIYKRLLREIIGSNPRIKLVDSKGPIRVVGLHNPNLIAFSFKNLTLNDILYGAN